MWDQKGHFRDWLAKSQEHDSTRVKGTLDFNWKYKGDAYHYGKNSNTDSAFM